MNRIGKRVVTQREVARAASVHPSTVSLALRNDSRLLPDTRARVLAAAKRLGYTQNPLVSLLMARVRRSDVGYRGTLAYVHTARPTPGHIHGKFLEGARRRAGELGYKLDEFYLISSERTPDALPRTLETRDISGVVVVHKPSPACPAGRLPFDISRFAVVAIGTPLQRPQLNYVANDQFMRPVIAARELLALGYRRLGLVLEEPFDGFMAHRCSAGFWAVQRFVPELEPIPILQVQGPESADSMREWLLRHRPEAVLATREWMLKVIRDAGLKVPGDIGWVHLDWVPRFAPWAGVYGNCERTGEAAVDMVVMQLHRGERGPPEHPASYFVAGTWMPGNSIRRVGPPLDLNAAFFADGSAAVV